MSAYHEKHACRLCFEPIDIQMPVFSLPATPIANSFPTLPDEGAERYPLDLVQCNSCGNVQLSVVLEGLFEDYKYSTPGTPHQKEFAKSLKTRFPKAERVLEIGSNNGSLLDALREKDFLCLGIDPAAPQLPGHERAYFTDDWAQRLNMTVDLVVASNVFAHIDDLVDVFQGIKRILAPEGAVVFEVQYLIDLIEYGTFDMIYHEHMNYHTLAPLSRFLTEMGLVMTDWEYIPAHGGSMRVTAKLEGRPAALPDERFNWDRLRSHFELVKARLHNGIAFNIPLVAFGASAKACTLINCTGIAPYISFCVDDTPQKQGRYIPGTNIRISPVARLKDETVLLTAWNYESIIRERIPNVLINPFTPG